MRSRPSLSPPPRRSPPRRSPHSVRSHAQGQSSIEAPAATPAGDPFCKFGGPQLFYIGDESGGKAGAPISELPAEDHHGAQARGTAAGNRPASLKRCSGRANLRAGEPGHSSSVSLAGANNVSGKAGVALLRVVMHAFAWPPPDDGGSAAGAGKAGKVLAAEGETAIAPKRDDGHASRNSRHAADPVPRAAPGAAQRPVDVPVETFGVEEGVKSILMHRRPHSATRSLDADRFEAAYEAARVQQNGHKTGTRQAEGVLQGEAGASKELLPSRHSGTPSPVKAVEVPALDPEADDDDFNSDWDSEDDSFSLISGRTLGRPLVRPAIPRLVLPPPGCLTVGGTEIDPATVEAANRELRENAAAPAAAPVPRGAR